MRNPTGGWIPAVDTWPAVATAARRAVRTPATHSWRPSAADRLPLAVAVAALTLVAGLALTGMAGAIAFPRPAPVLALAVLFGCSEAIVTRMGPGRFPIVVAIRSMTLVVAMLIAPPVELIAAHALGGALAFVATRPQHVGCAAACLSTSVLGTALGATAYSALVDAGDESIPGWWFALFLAVLIASTAGSIGLGVEWRRAGNELPRRTVALLASTTAVVAGAAASIGMTMLIFIQTDPAELLLLAGPAIVTALAVGAYASQRRRQEQVEFLYRCARILNGVSSGAAMLTELLDTIVARFEADRAEILLDRMGTPALRAAVSATGAVEPLAPVDPEVARRGLPVTSSPDLDDARADAIAQPGNAGLTLVLPLGAAGDPTGILVVTRGRRRRSWSGSDRRLLQAIASNIGSALGTSRMVDELHASLENLDRLAALVTAADDAIIGVRADATIASWNRGAEQLFGWSADEVMNVHADALGTVAGRPGLAEAFARAGRGEHVRGLHADAQRKDGAVVPIAVTMSPIRAEDGTTRGVSIVARDETPRALQDTVLRESLDRFQRVFEGSPVGIGVIGQDFTWLRVNDAMCRMLDLPEAAVVGHRFERSLARDDIEAAHGLVSRLLRGETEGSMVEVRLRLREELLDQRGIAALTVRPLRTPDGGLQALCTMEDVTAWRRSEERGRATEGKVQAAILDMTATREPDAILATLLAAARAILDASAAGVAYLEGDGGQVHSRVDGDHDSTARLEVAEAVAALRDRSARPSLDASTGHVSEVLTVPLEADALVIGALCVARADSQAAFDEGDRAVAARLATHAALSLENARAHQRALALVRELDTANLALQQASEAKSRFLANVSHELRTPLHSILLAAQLLHEPGIATDRHRTRELPGVIEGSGRYLLGLIDDLVDLSRIELSDIRLRFADVHLDAVLHDVRRQVRPLAAERGIRLRIASGRDVRVTADPLRLRQVLLNLLSNAVKYTEPRGRVDLRARVVGATLVIEVRDTGIGIDPSAIERAFEPFERLGRDAITGAGLGLSIARRIVELHDGTLTARSAPGVGSTFTVTIPAHPDVAHEPDVLPLPTVTPERGHRVLLVDDDVTAVQLLGAVLDRAGYEPIVTGSLESARRTLHTNVVDAVLLDRRLPDGDGLDLLRSPDGTGSIAVPVIVLSASVDEAAASLAAGAVAHLAKPIAVGELLDRLDQAIGPSRDSVVATVA